jgi:hypothetical protein
MKQETTTSTADTMDTDFETAPATRPFSFAQIGAVTLLVGPDEQPLIAHETYVTQNSEFFKAAMKKEWFEGQNRVIKLPEVETETVENYLAFTYGRGLPTAKMNYVPKLTPEAGPWNVLVELYIFGERVLDKYVRNEVIKEIVRVSELLHENQDSMMCSASHICFDGTPGASPIRRLMVDLYTFNGTEKWLTSSYGAHPEFLFQLSRGLLNKVSSRDRGTFRGRRLKAEDYFV